MSKYKDYINPSSAEVNVPKGSANTDNAKVKQWEIVLNRAWEIRSFEIELFWKRSTYFSVLVGALFIAYYNITKCEDLFILKILIAILGFVASFVWFLSNKGSKFWQENWELHIDQIERESGCNRIHSVVLNKSDNLLGLGAGSYSVSKLNTFFSLIVCISWLIVIIYTLFPLNFINTFIINYIEWIAVVILVILAIILPIFCKTNLKKSFTSYTMSPNGELKKDNKDIIAVYIKNSIDS